jgi:hypothetical protein
MRAFATALPCAVLLATEDESFAELVLTPQFGDLHPYNPECWTKLEHLLRNGHVGNEAGWSKLWDRAADLWISEGLRIPHIPTERLGIFNSLISISGALAVIHGEAYRARWRALWTKACESGAVNHPYLKINLAILGSHVGEGDAHMEYLLSREHNQLELADLLLFVRTDRSPELPELFARLVRNQPGELVDYLLPSRPAASLNRLFRFIRTTMRRKANFSSPSLVFATLGWAGAGIDLARELARDGVISERDRAVLERSLQAAEQVQVMEKNRFWDIVEQLPAGPLRKQVEKLWSYISAPNAAA